MAPRSCGPAVAAQAAEQIAGEALGVDAHQRRVRLSPAGRRRWPDARSPIPRCGRRSPGSLGAFSSGTRADGDLAQAGRGGRRIGEQIGGRNAEQAEPLGVGCRHPARTGAASTAGSSRPSLARTSAAGASSGTGAGSGCGGQQLPRPWDRPSPRSGPGASSSLPRRSATTGDARLDRPVQHGRCPHRRQQQHRRLGRQHAPVRPARAAPRSRPRAATAAPRRSAAPASPGAVRRPRDAPCAVAAPPGRVQRPAPVRSDAQPDRGEGMLHRITRNGTMTANFRHDSRQACPRPTDGATILLL